MAERVSQKGEIVVKFVVYRDIRWEVLFPPVPQLRSLVERNMRGLFLLKARTWREIEVNSSNWRQREVNEGERRSKSIVTHPLARRVGILGVELQSLDLVMRCGATRDPLYLNI